MAKKCIWTPECCNRAAPLPEIPSDFSEREGDTTLFASRLPPFGKFTPLSGVSHREISVRSAWAARHRNVISVDEPSENGFHTVRDAAPADKVEQPSPSAAQPKNVAAILFWWTAATLKTISV